jgi:hypothetical protein
MILSSLYYKVKNQPHSKLIYLIRLWRVLFILKSKLFCIFELMGIIKFAILVQSFFFFFRVGVNSLITYSINGNIYY